MRKKRILIAEDERYMRHTLELILERHGYEVLGVDNGRDALEVLVHNQINNTPVDLLLCDIQMPLLSGEELIAAMQQRKISTPVLVITGFGDKELVIRLMRLGCRDFVDKPFTPRQIEERVNLLLSDMNSREIERRRRDFMAQIGEIARTTAHDINNVVGATLGYADMLLEETGPEDPKHGTLKKISSSARRAVEICRDLLLLDSTTIKYRRVRTDIIVLIERVASLLRDVLPRTIVINTDCCRGPVWYHADARRLQQALLNLGVNAADAVSEGGEITLGIGVRRREARAKGGTEGGEEKSLRIYVADNGKGMPAEIIPYIFKEGYSTRETGSGIGLFTVKRIVEEHGGRLEVESSPGEGTCFQLLFPLCQRSGAG
ncbi:MAG: response regulator [Chitinivibrionales bacterium]|nr:response regulator [Chitinivibrionales bacterium]MBD3358163.1 response regulator [Chitinivibrionales bacterium]